MLIHDLNPTTYPKPHSLCHCSLYVLRFSAVRATCSFLTCLEEDEAKKYFSDFVKPMLKGESQPTATWSAWSRHGNGRELSNYPCASLQGQAASPWGPCSYALHLRCRGLCYGWGWWLSTKELCRTSWKNPQVPPTWLGPAYRVCSEVQPLAHFCV